MFSIFIVSRESSVKIFILLFLFIAVMRARFRKNLLINNDTLERTCRLLSRARMIRSLRDNLLKTWHRCNRLYTSSLTLSLSLSFPSAITDDYRQPRLQFLASKPDKRDRRGGLPFLRSICSSRDIDYGHNRVSFE